MKERGEGLVGGGSRCVLDGAYSFQVVRRRAGAPKPRSPASEERLPGALSEHLQIIPRTKEYKKWNREMSTAAARSLCQYINAAHKLLYDPLLLLQRADGQTAKREGEK